MATRGFNAHAPKVLAALRVMTALLYVEHGMIKLFGFPAGAPPGKVPLMGLFGVAGVLEFVGGLLILLGLFTRPVAFLLAGQMAVAYFMAHAPSSPYPAINHGEPAILFCFIFLYLSVAGPGAWSIDGGRR
nr:DoxX family protein [Polymorphobacter sp.]